MHLRCKVGGATLVGGDFGKLHTHGLQTRFGTPEHFQTEFIVLVHGADLLGVLFFHQDRHTQAHLVVVGGGKRVLELVEGLIHFTSGCDREKIDHVLLELHRHGGHVLGCTNVADHGKNLVLVDQLLRGQHGAAGVIGRIFDQQLELAAIDAALLVGFVHTQHHA